MIIDPETNLPQLNEGYFWRVVDEHHLEIRKVVPAGEWEDWMDKPDEKDHYDHMTYTYGPGSGYSFSDNYEREDRIDSRVHEIVDTYTVEVPQEIVKKRFLRSPIVKNIMVLETKTKNESVDYLVEQRRWRRKASSNNVYTHRFGTWETKFVEQLSFSGRGYVTAPEEFLMAPDPITKTNLYDRCLIAVEGWNAHKEKLDLFGDYPPKKHN